MLEKYNIYLQNVKQRNEIDFNENGTIVRSLSTASFGAGSAGVTEMNTVEVKLNQPFIYIIKDINGSPTFNKNNEVIVITILGLAAALAVATGIVLLKRKKEH